jgi:hypothetical protein
MKEIKLYSDRSYATEILCNETISLVDAINICKHGGLMILVIKDSSMTSKYLQIVNINNDNKIRVSEQHINSKLVVTWIDHDIFEFINSIKENFPKTEGYVISSYSELYKIMKVHFPEWIT